MVRSVKGSSDSVNASTSARVAAYDAVLAWFDSPLGRSLQAVEAHRLRTALPGLYGCNALQLGRIGKMDLLDASVAPTRIIVDAAGFRPGAPSSASRHAEQMLTGSRTSIVCAEPDALPLDGCSIDLALLPHTLDFAADPHPILREVSRVLRPEGHVVILGFNPMSLWGLRRLLAPRSAGVPWCAHFFRLARVKDWLALLDFEFMYGSMLYYRPPMKRENSMDRFYFMEKAGDRWWPMMAAVYLIIAKKRVFGMTPLPVSWKVTKTPRLIGTEPAVRGIARGWHRLRRDG
jgi:SAM-dependent methyltransferase